MQWQSKPKILVTKAGNPLVSIVANVVTGVSVIVFQIIGTRIIAINGPDNLGVWGLAVELAGLAQLFAFNLNTGLA